MEFHCVPYVFMLYYIYTYIYICSYIHICIKLYVDSITFSKVVYILFNIKLTCFLGCFVLFLEVTTLECKCIWFLK